MNMPAKPAPASDSGESCPLQFHDQHLSVMTNGGQGESSTWRFPPLEHSRIAIRERIAPCNQHLLLLEEGGKPLLSPIPLFLCTHGRKHPSMQGDE